MLFPKRVAVSAVVAVAGVVGAAGVAGAHAPHVVQPGDTLSELVPGRWVEVARGNGIADPDLIFVGQVIDLDATAPAPAPVPRAHRQAPARQAAPATGGGVWDKLAECESGGDWSIATGNGYYGGLQFAPGSWRAAGGSGNPAAASREEQIRVAENLLGMQGWGAWPACSRKLGLR